MLDVTPFIELNMFGLNVTNLKRNSESKNMSKIIDNWGKLDTHRENHHVKSILKIARCPICKGKQSLNYLNSSLECKCGSKFYLKGNTIDFVSEVQERLSDNRKYIQNRSLANWGRSLHAGAKNEKLNNFPDRWHNYHFIEYLDKKDIYSGDILEIGCGEGIDARIAASKFPNRTYYALDIGENISDLSVRDEEFDNLHYIRGNSLNLPINDSSIDSIISFGVFHHTYDPQKCMIEAFRILRENGSLCIYLYKNHEDNILKYLGVQLEKAIMQVTSKMSISTGRRFCWFISPIILLLFSWPSQVLKKFKRFNEIGRSFPLHWGTTPSSIINDLQDRLLALINFRFSKEEFKGLFFKAGFSDVEIVTTIGGHYGYGKKHRFRPLM